MYISVAHKILMPEDYKSLATKYPKHKFNMQVL